MLKLRPYKCRKKAVNDFQRHFLGKLCAVIQRLTWGLFIRGEWLRGPNPNGSRYLKSPHLGLLLRWLCWPCQGVTLNKLHAVILLVPRNFLMSILREKKKSGMYFKAPRDKRKLEPAATFSLSGVVTLHYSIQSGKWLKPCGKNNTEPASSICNMDVLGTWNTSWVTSSCLSPRFSLNHCRRPLFGNRKVGKLGRKSFVACVSKLLLEHPRLFSHIYTPKLRGFTYKNVRTSHV